MRNKLEEHARENITLEDVKRRRWHRPTGVVAPFQITTFNRQDTRTELTICGFGKRHPGRIQIFGRGAIQSDCFPSSNNQNWMEWRKQFSWVSDANNWTNGQAMVFIPTCLTRWALDEFTAMAGHLNEQVDDQPEPKLEAMLE